MIHIYRQLILIIINKIEEDWRKIEGFENFYVSNLGRVRNVKSNKILKENIKNGYAYVGLTEGTKQKSCRVHRLVANAFIDNPENKKYVNHIDGNKLNNRVDNLEWITASDNVKHALNNNLFCTQARKVSQYDKKGNLIKTFNSLAEASNVTGIDDSSICKVCKNNDNHKTASGFI